MLAQAWASIQDVLIASCLIMSAVVWVFVAGVWLFGHTINRVLPIACFLFFTFWIVAPEPGGFNLSIYAHNADLTLAGKQAFGREVQPDDGPYETSSQHPARMDYTGLQQVAYVGMEYLSIHSPLPGTELGFRIWDLLWIAITFAAVLMTRWSDLGGTDTDWRWPMATLFLNPVFAWLWALYGWQDRLPLVGLPVLALALLSHRKTGALAFVSGLGAALNGTLGLFAVAFAMHRLRQSGWRALNDLALLALGCAVGFAPFFPEAIAGWSNRAERLNMDVPFWYSFYSLLPHGVYSALFDKVVVTVASAAVVLGVLFGRLSLSKAIVFSVAIPITLVDYDTPDKIIPVAWLLMLVTPGLGGVAWVVFFLSLLAEFLLAGQSPSTIAPVDAAIANLPLFVAAAFLLTRSLRFEFGSWRGGFSGIRRVPERDS